MDVKVYCPCGAKYQFPVEPVEGRMPQTIACPLCGADNTEIANQRIQEQLGAASGTSAQPTAKPGLRLSTAQHAAPASAPPPPSPTRFTGGTQSAKAQSKTKKLKTILTTTVLVVIGAFAIYKKGSKVFNEVRDFARSVMGVEEPEIRWTLPDDNWAGLLIKHDNQTNVAEILTTAYLASNKQRLNLMPATDEFDEQAKFVIWPAYKGAVEISGPLDWPEADASAAAAAISKQLNTYVVLALMGDDSEAGTVAIFENGERKFRMKRWYQITSLLQGGIKEHMEREGEEWAKTHGYVPSPADLLDSDDPALPFEDVNQLVLNLGMDISDRPEETTGILVLKP